MLSHSKEEVEALIKTYSSPAQLATFVVAMKRSVSYSNSKVNSRLIISFATYRDYEALKEKKVALQREKDKLCQECSQMRREVSIIIKYCVLRTLIFMLPFCCILVSFKG